MYSMTVSNKILGSVVKPFVWRAISLCVWRPQSCESVLQELTLENAKVVLDLLEASKIPNCTNCFSTIGPAPPHTYHCVILENRTLIIHDLKVL